MMNDAAVVVEEITTLESLERLRPEWSRVWAENPSATPFQSPEWLIPWWRHIGQGQLWTLALHEGRMGRLVGVVPLYLYRRGDSGLREVFSLGIATTDYLDGLFARGWESAGAAATFAHLDAHGDRWDVLDLQQLRAQSPLLRAPAVPRWHEQVTFSEPCPALYLPAGIQHLDQVAPSQLWQNLNYYRRRAARLGRVEYGTAHSGNLSELFDSLTRLHRARWMAQGEYGVLADASVHRWHAEVLPGLLSLGVLRLYALRLGGRIVAVLYGLADRPVLGRRFYYYLGGFDPKCQQISPGTLIIAHALEQAIHEGAGCFDFLRGREAYKYLWGAKDAPTFRRRIRQDKIFTSGGAESQSLLRGR